MRVTGELSSHLRRVISNQEKKRKRDDEDDDFLAF